jgi:hypothetical protein
MCKIQLIHLACPFCHSELQKTTSSGHSQVTIECPQCEARASGTSLESAYEILTYAYETAGHATVEPADCVDYWER